MYCCVKGDKGQIFGADERRTFGMIIGQCARLGFSDQLIARLRGFNTERVTAVHKYLLGATGYEALRTACDKYEGLDAEVQQSVISEIGVPAKRAEDLVGNLIFRRELKQGRKNSRR